MNRFGAAGRPSSELNASHGNAISTWTFVANGATPRRLMFRRRWLVGLSSVLTSTWTSSPPLPVVLLLSQSRRVGDPARWFATTGPPEPAWQTTTYGTGKWSSALAMSFRGMLLIVFSRLRSPPTGTIGSGGRSALTAAAPSSSTQHV